MFVHSIDKEMMLKLPEKNDAEALFRVTDDSREHLREWLPWLDTTKTIEDTKAFIESGRKGYAEGRSLTTLVMYHGEVAGVAGYNEIDADHEMVKIGYWLGDSFQGKGVMSRVVEALIDHAFSHMNMNRVEIRVAAENEKSAAIPKRLGFQEEGRIRSVEWLYDHYVDHKVYGLLADEWKV